MARPLLIFVQKTTLPLLPGIEFFVALVGVISVFSIVGFLCGSHGGLKRSNTYKREKNTVHLGDRKPRISVLKSGLSGKALLMAKMVSWRKVEQGRCEDDDDDDDDEEAVWKRTIIMGERCRPLEFSGKISYDENGNPIPEKETGNKMVGMPKS